MSLEFYNHKKPIARKEHICEMCGQKIMVGERYSRDVGKYDGDFFTRDLHLDCSETLLRFIKEEDVDEFRYDEIAEWWESTRCSKCKHEDGKCAEDVCNKMTRRFWCDKFEEESI